MIKRTFTQCASAVALAMLLPSLAAAQQQAAVRIAVPGFLSGPAAASYGLPSKNAAELLIEAINEGRVPAPYSTPGFGGKRAEATFIDEDGGNTKQVAEYRNLVQKRGVDAVVGYVSSGTCQAIAPVAEELKTLTLFTICGTPRIFEGAPRQFVFRTQITGTAEAVGAARYVKDTLGAVKTYTGINQNYAWGQDSWKDFVAAMSKLTAATPSEAPLWPKVFQGEFSSEISALALAPEELVMSSFWGPDLDAFVLQASNRGLLQKKRLFLTMGAAEGIFRLGRQMPDGVIVGARGPYSVMAREKPNPLNRWFIAEYQKRFGQYPPAPAYQTATGVLALKAAYDAAAASRKGAPAQADVIASLRGLEFETLTTRVRMARANGHQAIMEIGFGTTKWDAAANVPGVANVKFYAPECVNPPDGVSGDDWVAGGMKGARC